MKLSSGVIVLIVSVAPLVEGCPFLEKKRELKEAGHDEKDIKRMLRGLFEGFSGQTHPRVRKLSSCDPDQESCYGRLFPDLSPFHAEWFDLLQMGLPGPDTDTSPSYMLEDFFPTNGNQIRTMGEVSATGNKQPTNWPQFQDFLARPGVGAAGYTYLGQMFSHDVNNDKNTKLGEVVDANDVSSAATAAADLDTMYGTMQRGKFSMDKVMRDGKPIGHDFPRNGDTADIFDERNDNTVIIAQIQILFQLYHNKVFDEYQSNGDCQGANECFDQAREETVKTWQSIIAHDLLPSLISTEVYAFMKSNGGFAEYTPLFYKPGTESYDEKRTPTEFSTCAYRVFHSRLAAAYLWGAPTGQTPFTGLASTFGEPDSVPASLVGGRPVDSQLLPMPWYQLFDLRQDIFDHSFPAPFTGHLLDVLYVDQLIKSPLGVPGNPSTPIELRCEGEGPACLDVCDGDPCFIVDQDVEPEIVDPNWGETASLASIDFLRGQTFQLPGGFAMNEFARAVVGEAGYPEIPKMNMNDITESKFQPFGLPAAWETEYDDIPCMLYMFMESILQYDPVGGRASRLGALGSYVVGETTLGFIRHAENNILDDLGFVSMANDSYEVTMKDLIEYIGATPILE